jgi:hypothetical protein
MLTPLVTTKNAGFFVNTNYFTALGTGPPFLFNSNKMSYAELPYVLKILNHTHTILSSIALIQVVQPIAGKAVTTEAVPDFGVHYLLTILDTARNAGFRFETVVTSATGACLSISYIRATETAVHSAGSDQHRANHVCLYRSYLHHTCIPA